ncbi:MAG: PAS domain S-box protein [archaeon]
MQSIIRVLELAYEDNKDYVLLVDDDLKIIWANNAFFHDTPNKKNKVLGKSCHEAFKNSQFHCDEFLVTEALNTGKQSFHRHKNEIHSATPFENAGREYVLYKISDGKAILGADADLSETKITSKAPEKSDEKYKLLFNNISNCVAIYEAASDGKDFIFVDVNKAAEISLRTKSKDMIGRRVTQVFPGIIKMGLLKIFSRVYKTGKPELFSQTEYKDKKLFMWVENYIFKLPSGLIVAIFNDYTEKHKIEEELKKSRNYYMSLFENLPNPIWMSGNDAKCNYFNKAWLDFTGQALEHEMGDGWTEGVHPDDLARCIKIYMGSFKERKPFVMEYRLKHNDGAFHWIIDYGTPLFDMEGKFSGYIGSCYDINERKIAEERMEQANLIIQNSSNIIFIWSAKKGWPVLFVSDNFSKWGYAASDFNSGKFCYADIVYKEDLPQLVEKVKNIEAINYDEIKIQYRIRKKDGSIIWVDQWSCLIRDEKGNPLKYEGIVKDITAQKEAEEIEQKKYGTIEKFNNCLKEIAKNASLKTGKLESFSKKLCEKVAKIICTRYVSIWFFDSDNKNLVSLSSYDSKKGKHTSIEILAVKDCSAYFKALNEQRVIAANDAINDFRTKEFKEYYFKKHKIVSMLDSPIRIGHDLVGILSFEHSGKIRSWSNEEQNFAVSLAEFISLTYSSFKLKKSEEEARAEKQFIEKIIENAPSIIIGLDENNRIILFNAYAENITKYKKEEVLNKKWVEIFGCKDTGSKDIFDMLKKGESNITYEEEIISKEGNKLMIFWSSSSFNDKKSELKFMFIGQDITEKSWLEQKANALNIELTKKIEDLERFQNLTVGRELKMLELKKRIKELEEQISSLK